jgi:hypothetical protein
MTSSQIERLACGSSRGSKGRQGDIDVPGANCGFGHDFTQQTPDQYDKS